MDGAIHRAAGPGLLAECIERYPDGCPTGEVRITSGHALRARFVMHAVGPIYKDGEHGESAALARCYAGAIALAAANGLATIAFPAISCGVYGYPWDAAARVAVRSILDALAAHPSVREARIVLLGAAIVPAFETALQEAEGNA